MKLYILQKLKEMNWYFALLDNIEEVIQKGYLQDVFLLFKPKEMVFYGKNALLNSIDLEKAKNKGIPVYRSVIPSRREEGVFYYGNTWSFKCFFSGDQKKRFQREKVFKDLIKKFYKSLGIELSSIYEDIEVKGTDKKIGTYYFKNFPNKKFCYGGTLFNLKKIRQDLDEFIILPKSKFADKSVKTIQERIITIPEVISRELSDKEFLESFENVIKELGLEYEKETDLPEEVWKIISKSAAKFKSQEWIKYGKWSPVKEYWRPK